MRNLPDYGLGDIDASDFLPEPPAPPASTTIRPRLLSYPQACEYLGGISEGTLRALVRDNELKPLRLRGAVRFDVRDLDTWIETQKGGSR